LLRRFMRYMRFRDVVYLIIKPFLGQKQGPTKNELLSRAVEHGALKEAAANLTTVPDNLLSAAVEDRKAG
jgi:anaerobic magnesium-protoporphyrin IX monomethyl ester cyclase